MAGQSLGALKLSRCPVLLVQGHAINGAHHSTTPLFTAVVTRDAMSRLVPNIHKLSDFNYQTVQTIRIRCPTSAILRSILWRTFVRPFMCPYAACQPREEHSASTSLERAGPERRRPLR